MREQQIADAHKSGVSNFLAKNQGQPSPGNDHVIADWQVTYDQNGLTAAGNVQAKSDQDTVELVVVAFTSPDYVPGGSQGQYYTGSWASIGGPPPTSGNQMGFILQSQQFTAADQGKTVVVHLQGWVNMAIFSFEKTIVIPKS